MVDYKDVIGSRPQFALSLRLSNISTRDGWYSGSRFIDSEVAIMDSVEQSEISDRIVQDPAILAGKPVIKGTMISTTPADAHELWERVRLLEGRKLNSTSGRSTFEILSVKSDVALIRIHSTGSERSIRRQEFDKALKFGMVTFSVTPSQIRESGASEFSPAYVAAIIRTVLGQNL